MTASVSSNLAIGTVRSASRERQARQIDRRQGRVIEREHRLKKRCPAGVAIRLQVLDQLLERDVRVGEGVERDVAHARQQLAEAHLGVERHPQDQRVHEEPDHVLRRLVAAVGDGRADTKIVLSREAEEHGLVERQERHEQRHAFVTAERSQAGDQVLVQRPRVGVSRRCGMARAWPIRGQLEERKRAGQLAAPVVELTIELALLQPALLPGRDVNRLRDQPRQRRGGAGDSFAVQRGELRDHDIDGPRVGDDVVHRHHEQMILVRDSDEKHAQERTAREIEGTPGLRLGARARFAEDDPRRRRALTIDSLDCERHARSNLLYRSAVYRVEAGTQ